MTERLAGRIEQLESRVDRVENRMNGLASSTQVSELHARLDGMDSLLSIVQMPAGVPVGTLAIGKPGAINAALLAVSILGVKSAKYRKIYDQFRKDQTKKVLTKRHLKLPAVG